MPWLVGSLFETAAQGTIGAHIITNTILAVSYCSYSRLGPKPYSKTLNPKP